MPGLSRKDWNSVNRLIGRHVGRIGTEIYQDRVIKRDVLKKLIWTVEFGDIPIPIVGFDYEVKVYDVQPLGPTWPVSGADATVKTKTVPRVYEVSPVVPKVGDIVIISLLNGSQFLPRCMGVIQARPRDYLVPPGEEF